MNKLIYEPSLTTHWKNLFPNKMLLLGSQNLNNWIGKSLQIYSCNVKAFGKETTALRIREAIPDTAEDVSKYTDAINQARTVNDLKAVFLSIPKHLKPGLIQLKDTKKEELNLV